MFQMNWFMDQMKKGYRPEQLTMNLLESRMKGTPMGDNLIKLAREGNGAELERIARNLAAQRGIDFDKEFAAFRKKFGL
jgi:hypothetical protein